MIISDPEPGVLASGTLPEPDGRQVHITQLTEGRTRLNIVNRYCRFSYDDAY